MLVSQALLARRRFDQRRRLHIQQILSGSSLKLRQGIQLLSSPELRMFFRLVRSPSHVLFFASNVAVLMHVKFLSSANGNKVVRGLDLELNELENYQEVINDLDFQTEAIQRQIEALKAKRNNNKVPKTTQDVSVVKRKKPLAEAAAASLHSSDAQNYVRQRAQFSTRLAENETFDHFFMKKDHPFEEAYAFGRDKTTYFSPMLNSMMMLSNLLLTSCLVELQLRFSVSDGALRKIMAPATGLLGPLLVKHLENDDKKSNLLHALHEIGIKLTQKPIPSKSFMNSILTQLFLDSFCTSDDFSCIESLRSDTLQYRSGRWLNHIDSDTHSNIYASLPIEFGSAQINDNTYIRDINDAFDSHYKSRSPLKNIILGLQIASIAGKGGEYTPSNHIFKTLLDSFGKAGLYNYQSIVYGILPSNSTNESALADSEIEYRAELLDHNDHQLLVQTCPEILESLIDYKMVREDWTTVNQLISILTSNSRFGDASNEVDGTQLLSNIRVIESALKACVASENYSLAGSLLDKLIYGLVLTPDGPKVVIGQSPSVSELVVQKLPWGDAMATLMTNRALQSLVESLLKTEDCKRLELLYPTIVGRESWNTSKDLNVLKNKVAFMIRAHKLIPDEAELAIKADREKWPKKRAAYDGMHMSLGPLNPRPASLEITLLA